MVWLAGNSFIRTARKRWRCDCCLGEIHGRRGDGHGMFCDREIAVGERYVESVDSAPAYQSGDRYCWDCAGHQGLVQDTQPWRHAQGCLLPWVGRPEARSCACGGQPDDWYAEVRL